MKSYVWVTFAFLGWAYYVLSDGSEFEPEQPQIAVVEPQEEIQPEIVTRADTTPLLSTSASNFVTPTPDPIPEPVTVVATVVAPLEAVEIDPASEIAVIEDTQPEPEVEVAVIEPVLDIRAVAGSRVNMRTGPSTDFAVITTLDGGTELEVLEVNAEGWAKISVLDSGVEGWMAERLLTAPQT